jgi:hypothetical protein
MFNLSILVSSKHQEPMVKSEFRNIILFSAIKIDPRSAVRHYVMACNETKCKNDKGNDARTVRKLSPGISFGLQIFDTIV